MLTSAQTQQLIRRFARLPMAKWEGAYTRLSTDQRYSLTDGAAQDATHFARVSAYVSRRQTGGKHADAVKRQNQTARSVRQALGYTYAQDAITF